VTGFGAAAIQVRRLPTDELSAADIRAIREVLDAAFDPGDPAERFTEDDWLHALGGTHVVVEAESRIVGHAAVVRRELHSAGRGIDTGYVEAVAVLPEAQGRGYGTRVIEVVNEIIRGEYELGALGTGEHRFYQRLGWRAWRGPTSVRTPTGERRTRDEDGFILVLDTPQTPSDLDLDAPLSCDWRPGDVW
jgi:aminoglycoside 2'-N-acetyltransferase I